ncbi:MAG TPA: hypothetical protein PKU93_01245 [Candidatus Pacearchaeota archaeon]|nr:hypothetical protein [Candidatus Pacearchaeota archaeon]
MISRQTLIEKLDLESIPNEQKLNILEKAADIVLEKTLLRLTKELNTEEVEKMNELLESDKQGEVAIMLYKKFPNINDIFDEEINIIKAQLVQKYGK